MARIQRKAMQNTFCMALFSGDNGIRTRDLCVANAALSQLSYVPKIPAARLLYSGSQLFVK